MFLRKGKTKAILDASIDSALLAIEVYNKPRTTFRSQAYISLMIMAWTRLFHAYFHNTIGDKYYYKKNHRYEIIDGERKAWELKTCIKEYAKLDEPIRKNLEFFILLRNKIEHRHIDAREVDVSIFGECQSLLFNFENCLIKFFGTNYSINESLVYSLQFSHLRTNNQKIATKTILSKDVIDILNYISKYRSSLSESVFNSQEFSIKLVQIPVPKIANTNRNDVSIKFINWEQLDEEAKEAYSKLYALIKDKKVIQEAVNVKKLKPKQVLEKVKNYLPHIEIAPHIHSMIWKIFKVRPPTKALNPFDTITEYCLYDEAHADYVYTEEWVEFLVYLFQSQRLTISIVKELASQNKTLDINDYKDSTL